MVQLQWQTYEMTKRSHEQDIPNPQILLPAIDFTYRIMTMPIVIEQDILINLFAIYCFIVTLKVRKFTNPASSHTFHCIIIDSLCVTFSLRTRTNITVNYKEIYIVS